jgi:hypothetical protein
MRLYTAFIALFLFSLSVAAQSRTAVPKAVKSVENIEDIEIGMSADLAIAGLTKRGYTFRDQFKGDVPDQALWSVTYGRKLAGEIHVKEGRVTAASVSVYNNQDGGGGIELAEALYWIFYDNGQTLPSRELDTKETATSAQFTTKEIEQRTPGSSLRIIFATMANGASYRILLMRGPEGQVWVDKFAPFVKKK